MLRTGVAQRRGVRSRNHLSRSTRRERVASLGLLLPAGIFITAFVVGPSLATIALSLYRWDFLGPAQFAGLSNYVGLTTLPGVSQIAGNTLLLSAGAVALALPCGLGLAVLADRNLKGLAALQAAIFLPYALPLVGSGIIWSWMLQPQYGLVAHALTLFGIASPNWLGDSHTVLYVLGFVSVWQTVGFYMIVFLGGLRSLNTDLSEAAAVDGAHTRTVFWRISLPQLRPTMVFAVVIAITSFLQTFDLVYVMTGGGPGLSSTTWLFSIYQQAFTFFSFGNSAAMTTLLLIAVTAIAFAVLGLSHQWDPS